jgi:PKD repeat protein
MNGALSTYTSQTLMAIYNYEYQGTCTQEGNIIDIQNGYYAYPVYIYHPTASTLFVKNNSYYVNAMSNQNWYTSNGSATNFAGWSTLGVESNAKFGDPKWNNAATYDLRSNTLMNQNNIKFNALNVKDANQVLRNTSSNDRGALEGYLDVQNVSSDFAPNPSECSGYTTSPTVTLKNNFIDVITGFDMGLSINGVLASTKTVTANIAIGATGTVTFNPVQFSKAGPMVVKIFLLNADDNPVNDTLTYTFNIKVSPGGGALSLNTTLSAPMAKFDITGKPDITTNGQPIVYDMTPPSRVGYTNADNLFNGGAKWFLGVSGVTKYGIVVPTAQLFKTEPAGTNNAYFTFNPTTAFVDSLITISFRVVDVVSGCDTIFKRNVLVAPQGVPGIKVPSTICDKDEVFFENTSTVSSGALLSTWDFGDGSPTVDATSPVYKYNGPGTYIVKLTVVTSPHGYVTSKSITINVNEIPTANFKNVNACAGTTVKLTNTTTIGSGTLSYSWDFGDGSPAVTTTNAVKLYAAPGGYKVTLTAEGNGCKNVVSKNVYQFAKPVASFVQTKGVCENDIFEFQNNSTIPLGEFGNDWDFNDGGNKATVTNPKYDFLTSGLKKVKLKVVSDFGCTDSMTVNVNVKTIATTGFTAPFACSVTPTQFTNITNLNGEILDNYFWDFGDGYTSSATAPIHSWASIGPKIVKLTTTLVGGCKSEATQILNVGVQPVVDFQFADQCAGSEVQFTNLTSFTQGNVTYLWDFGDANTSTQTAPKHTYATGVGTQSFTVTLKAKVAGGCADSSIKTIDINPLPTTCDFDMTRDYSTGLTAYKFTPKGGATSGIDYTWLFGDGGLMNTSGNTSGGATSYTYSNAGKYCATMVAKNLSGCECSRTICNILTLDINSAAGMNNLISIYPNPTNGVFNVKLDANVSDNMTVNIYNAIGSLVKTVTVDTNNTNIDLSGFANGVYMVKVIADDQIATKQIILNK